MLKEKAIDHVIYNRIAYLESLVLRYAIMSSKNAKIYCFKI